MNLRQTKINAPDSFIARIEELEEKLQEASTSRELTSWDLYRIKRVITKPETFAAELAALEPNTSAIVNCYSFIYNGQRYYRGDMIIKDENGNLIRIEAENQGVWKPTVDKDGNLEFQFDADTDVTNNDEAVKTTPFTPTYIYGLVEDVQDDHQISFNETVRISLNEEIKIQPIIRFYNTDNEEVYWDYEITSSTTTITEEGSDTTTTVTTKTIANIPACITTVVIK